METAELADVELGPFQYNFAAPSGLDVFQQGYATDALTGVDLTSAAPGDWRPSWLVFGRDFVDDPVFVDIHDPEMAVLVAHHGVGSWNPVQIAPSFRAFVAVIDALRSLAQGRETPVALEERPPSREELVTFNAVVQRQGGRLVYWSLAGILAQG